MKRLRILTAACLTLLLASAAQAGDPTGSWKWKLNIPTGDTIDVSLKLELKEGKLTGTYSNQFGDAPIKDASFVDETVTFSVDREIGGSKFTIKYNGKLEGDALKGSVELPDLGGGGPSKTDWNAARDK
jgi:hypothetical protein